MSAFAVFMCSLGAVIAVALLTLVGSICWLRGYAQGKEEGWRSCRQFASRTEKGGE